MRLWGCVAAGILLLGCPAVSAQGPESGPLPAIAANDNRTPAGHLQNGILELKLELRHATFYPDAPGGISRDAYAFGEAGGAPQSPGPLIRVPEGTAIHATVHNALPKEAKIYGLHTHPGAPKDCVTLAPGETRELRFAAGQPGTYLYWATTSNSTLDNRVNAETILSGAYVVDPRGAKPDDRIFVISIWTDGQDIDSEAYTINGKSWPFTEHLNYTIGDTVHWRVLNTTYLDHAMHLHGFFFDVDGVGDGETYTQYAPDQRRLVVTEHIDAGHVFNMTWTPERPGNWLFHCHMVMHIVEPEEAGGAPESASMNMSAHDAGAGMGGLVLGIIVHPREGDSTAPAVGSAAPTAPAAHKLQLVISDNPEKTPAYKLEVNDPRQPAAPASSSKTAAPSLLGPPIFLTRGEPAEIEVKNETEVPTTIHWHGIEIESYYDGVAGWTGSGQHLSPEVAPGTSFVARMTPPRAGTFIYHTHSHDPLQLVNGVYGPLIVLEPGEKFDADHDRILVFSIGVYGPMGRMLLINGRPEPRVMRMKAGETYRLRLINITANGSDLQVRMVKDDALVDWKVVACDGAAFPPAQLKTTKAAMGITVGQTYDVEYRADSPGLVNLEIWQTNYPMRVTLPMDFATAK